MAPDRMSTDSPDTLFPLPERLGARRPGPVSDALEVALRAATDLEASDAATVSVARLLALELDNLGVGRSGEVVRTVAAYRQCLTDLGLGSRRAPSGGVEHDDPVTRIRSLRMAPQT